MFIRKPHRRASGGVLRRVAARARGPWAPAKNMRTFRATSVSQRRCRSHELPLVRDLRRASSRKSPSAWSSLRRAASRREADRSVEMVPLAPQHERQHWAGGDRGARATMPPRGPARVARGGRCSAPSGGRRGELGAPIRRMPPERSCGGPPKATPARATRALRERRAPRGAEELVARARSPDSPHVR